MEGCAEEKDFSKGKSKVAVCDACARSGQAATWHLGAGAAGLGTVTDCTATGCVTQRAERGAIHWDHRSGRAAAAETSGRF